MITTKSLFCSSDNESNAEEILVNAPDNVNNSLLDTEMTCEKVHMRLKALPPSGIVFRYSWADLAEIFRQCVCCANLTFCKFLVHKDCPLMSY